MKTMLDHGNRTGNNSRIFVESHPREHLSDLVARWLIMTFWHWRKGAGGNQTVLVGRGGYDEHGNPDARECEATLAAKDLGVAELPELQPLLRYTFMVDHDGEGKGVLKFGRLVELMHNLYPDQPQRVRQWARVLIEASVWAELTRQRGGKVLLRTRAAFKFIMAAYRRVRGEFPREVREELEGVLNRFKPDMEIEPFSLLYCVCLLCHRFHKVRRLTPVEWIADALRAELTFQRMFLAAEPHLKRAVHCPITIKERAVEAVFVHSDEYRIHSVVFSEWRDAVLTIARRASGHVQIFRRKRGTAWLNTTGLVSELRAREEEKRGLPPSPFGELTLERSQAGAGCWFFQVWTGHILNSAPTNPAVEPTRLSDEEIVDALLVGLGDGYDEHRERLHFERSRKLAEALAGR